MVIADEQLGWLGDYPERLIEGVHVPLETFAERIKKKTRTARTALYEAQSKGVIGRLDDAKGGRGCTAQYTLTAEFLKPYLRKPQQQAESAVPDGANRSGPIDSSEKGGVGENPAADCQVSFENPAADCQVSAALPYSERKNPVFKESSGVPVEDRNEVVNINSRRASGSYAPATEESSTIEESPRSLAGLSFESQDGFEVERQLGIAGVTYWPGDGSRIVQGALEERGDELDEMLNSVAHGVGREELIAGMIVRCLRARQKANPPLECARPLLDGGIRTNLIRWIKTPEGFRAVREAVTDMRNAGRMSANTAYPAAGPRSGSREFAPPEAIAQPASLPDVVTTCRDHAPGLAAERADGAVDEIAPAQNVGLIAALERKLNDHTLSEAQKETVHAALVKARSEARHVSA